MRYGWTALAAACFVAVSVQAQEAPLEARYEQVQNLNNAAWEAMNAEPRDPAKLTKAADLLHQSLDASARLYADIVADDALALSSRRIDAYLRLIKIYLQLGDRSQALDAVEAMLKEPRVSSLDLKLLSDSAFDGLRAEPRFQAAMASLQRMTDRWDAPAIATKSDELDEAHRIAGLSLLWSEARYNFVYFDHVPELDWNQVYIDTLPKVIAAKNLHEYYDVLMRTVAQLHDGHSNVMPPASIKDEFYASPAIRTDWIDGHVLVTRVDSPALAGQVHVGDEVVSVDDVDVQRYARERVVPYVSSSTPQDARVRTYDYGLLAGDHRHPVALGLLDASGRARRVALSREPDAAAHGAPSFQWRMLPGEIAYLAINEFVDDAGLNAFQHQWPTISKAKGLILDVRGNGGGSSQYGEAILAYLSDKPVPEGRHSSLEYIPVMRAWSGPYTAWHTFPVDGFSEEHEQRYGGPVVVLTGAHTFSAGEDFVMMFDAMKRGTLIGEATGGSTGQPLSFALPGGGSARVCAKRDTYPDGREFVGKGIEPQITVAPTVADIRVGRDPVLARALAVLSGQAGKTMTPAP